ncbi:fibronectin type III domain-containing protein [Acinetobacter sp. ANC 4640]
MSSVNLTWDAAGQIDSYKVYRSTSPMNPSGLPAPLATGITAKSYSDTTAVTGTPYYYRVASVKNGVEKVSDEVIVFTEKLLVFLPFTKSNKDYGSLGLTWVNSGNVTFGADGAYFSTYAQSLYQMTHAVNFNNDFKISFEIKRTDSNNTYPNIFDNDNNGTWSPGSFGLALGGDSAIDSLKNKIFVSLSYNYANPISITLSNNVFYFAEMQRSSGVVTIRINGSIVLTYTDTKTSNINSFLRIGFAQTNGSNGQFKGYIRNFKIYDLN